jgi:PAS domain S-box-containing protein
MDPRKISRSIRLQTRLILYSTLLVFFLMVLIILVVEKRQSETIEAEARKRGLAIARNLAAVSTNALVTYNYIVLQQNAGKMTLEEDVIYVIIQDKEENVAVYSGHDEKQGSRLSDPISQRALKTPVPLIQPTSHGEEKIPLLDISVPVYIKGSEEKWGTVRIGLSLEKMLGQISKTRLNLLLLGFFGLLLGTGGSILLARRISRPISRLVETTVSAAAGNLEQTIDIHTGDEIEELGRNFDHMIRQIRLHRDELENRLREITAFKNYTDRIISSMTNGLMTVDLDGRLVTLNETAEKILGKSKEEMVREPVNLVLGDPHPFTTMMMETLSRDQGVFRREIELKKEDNLLWLMASTSLLKDGEGRKIGALMIFQDITEIKDLEEKLRQADRLAALGTLSAGLAHEIKNPLSAIKTFVQLLSQKGANPSFMDRFNNTVPREIDRINQLVEDLLELTRTRKRSFVHLDVRTLVTQVIDLHGEEMKRKHIAFEGRLDPETPLIRGDSETLFRALSNLVINSIQAMPNGGQLSISSLKEDSGSPLVKMIIEDSGIGMDQTTLKNLFNPFFTTKEKGVGLGMALVRKIVEDHRGTIEAISDKDKGTTFILRLPVVEI